MKTSSIEIHAGGVDRPYETVAPIEVKLSAASVFSSAPSIEEAEAELRQKAAEMYANAVIDVEYSRGMSLTSYKVLKARGLAVILESEEIPCPLCAETIKRAAKRCKHCGADVAR